MLLILHLVVSLFLLHSALMSGERVFAILAFLLLLIPAGLFVMLLIQRKQTRLDFYLSGQELVLAVEKDGLLPLSGLKYTISFTYDQTGEGAVIKNSASALKGRTEIVLYPELLYTGSGSFTVEKCTISDYAGFFRLKLVSKRRPVKVPVDLMPEEKEVLLEPMGDPGMSYYSEYTKTVQRPGDDASETYDIREYREGDRISRMHWKLSAKRESPMIRIFSAEDNARFLFMLALGEKRQEEFHKVISNYFNLAGGLPEEERAHVVLFEDPRGELTEIPVETAQDLENALLTVYAAYARENLGEEGEEAGNGYFSPHSPQESLDEYHRLFGGRRFIREFLVTDEPLNVLAERWNEDED